jgi:preprotein translocase subunit SecG
MTLLFSWTGLIHGVLWVVLVVSMLLLIAVILLQEGKGGGLAEAFGGAGAETFGVKAHGINKFTAFVGGVFLLSCILLVKTRSGPDQTPMVPQPEIEAPAPVDPNSPQPPK